MSFPNITDIVATTIESRSGKIADNVTKNNAFLSWIKANGGVKTVSGGSKIYQEFSFAENGNFSWYSGYETLSVAAQDVISGAEFSFKQAAAPVVVSGLELLQNSGKEAVIDLLESRIAVAEATMANKISEGIYSDGTNSGGKTITGLQAMIADDPTTGTYGGINRANWTFWQNQHVHLGYAGFDNASVTYAILTAKMNELWGKCVRGADRPRLILSDSTGWAEYLSGLQTLQQFTSTQTAGAGFPSLKYMDADFVLDGGIGGFCPTARMYFINPKYCFFRPHKDRNMVPLSPQRRVAINQDASVEILAWAGNVTCNGAQFQGVLLGTT